MDCREHFLALAFYHGMSKHDHDRGEARIIASASHDSHEGVVKREQPLGRTCPSIEQLGSEFHRCCVRAKLSSS